MKNVKEERRREKRNRILDEAGKLLTDAQTAYDTAVFNYNNCCTAVSDTEKEVETLKAALEETQKSGSDDEEIRKAESALSSKSELLAAYNIDLEVCIAALTETETALNEAKKNYQSVKTSTDRAVESAQNAVSMSKYYTGKSETSDMINSLNEQLGDCTIYAPVSGVITAVNASVGDMNQAGATIITIEDNENKKLVADVTETDILKLEENMPAVITSNVLPDMEINGEISRVVRVKNQSSSIEGTGTGYTVEINVDKNDLLIGMSAKAKITLLARKDVFCVPYDLVKYDGDQAYILIAEKSSDDKCIATRVNINAGDEIDYYVEIISSNAKEGDYVIFDSSISEGDEFTPNYMDDSDDASDSDEAPESESEVIE